MCSAETKPQPTRPILIFAIVDASSGRRSLAKRDGGCRLQPAMIRLDIAYRTGADGRPLAVFRFAPNSGNSHAIPTQICKRALDHSVWPITSVCCRIRVSQEPLSLDPARYADNRAFVGARKVWRATTSDWADRARWHGH